MDRSRIIVPIVALFIAFIIGVYQVPDLIILFAVLAVVMFAIIKRYWFDWKGSEHGKK